MSITINDLEKIVNSGLTTNIIKSEINFGQVYLNIDVKDIISTILFLKTNDKCRFKQLIDITAADFPNRENRFKIVYLLLSHENNVSVIVNTNIEEKKIVTSLTKIFIYANWMEREVFDMYGISFKEHPELLRILTHYVFKG